MPRRVRELSDIEIDEISLVDRPANPHATVTIAKRATEEEIVPDIEIFSEDGQRLDENELKHGDVVFDAEKNPYMYVEDEEAEETAPESQAKTKEPVGAGISKSADPFGKTEGKSLGERVREDLSKAMTEMDRDEVISKALDEISKADERARAAEEIAKSERTLRLEKEYIAKAATYQLPLEAEDLGPVLMRMAETMSYEDCSVVAKALDAASEAFEYLQGEIGFDGGGSNNEVLGRVDAYLDEQVSKASEPVNKAAAMESFFDTNPDAYDEYVSSRADSR